MNDTAEHFDDYPVRRGFSGDGWALEDCEGAARENPETFKRPNAAELDAISVGDLVRLHFVLQGEAAADPDAPRAERMWVEVCKREADRWLGHLTNQPGFIDALDPGDVIEFMPRHVAQLT